MNMSVDRFAEPPRHRTRSSGLLGEFPSPAPGAPSKRPALVGGLVPESGSRMQGRGARKEGPLKHEERSARRPAAAAATEFVGGSRPAAPNEDMIRMAAYFIYLARGASPGDAVADWLKAEAELRDMFMRRTGA